MAIVPLPLPPATEAQALLHHLLEQGDIVGRDTAGRTIIQLAMADWALEKLLAFDAEAADLEDGSDDEPDDDAEEDGRPTVLDLVRPNASVGGATARLEGCHRTPGCGVLLLHRLATSERARSLG